MTLYDLFNHDILDESKAYAYINYVDNIVICSTYSKFLERS